MAEQRQMYRCEKCGNLVEVLAGGPGKLVCCGVEMPLLRENTVDAAVEKHVPVIARDGTTVTVTVGSVAHPMQEQHYIYLIEVLTADRVYHAFLQPGQEPQATFAVSGEVIAAREYCTLHGLWKS